MNQLNKVRNLLYLLTDNSSSDLDENRYPDLYYQISGTLHFINTSEISNYIREDGSTVVLINSGRRSILMPAIREDDTDWIPILQICWEDDSNQDWEDCARSMHQVIRLTLVNKSETDNTIIAIGFHFDSPNPKSSFGFPHVQLCTSNKEPITKITDDLNRQLPRALPRIAIPFKSPASIIIGICVSLYGDAFITRNIRTLAPMLSEYKEYREREWTPLVRRT